MPNHEDIKLVYKLEYSQPIRVTDFTNSLGALDSQFTRFLKRKTYTFKDPGVKFYIREIKKGSIEADLLPIVSLPLLYPETIQVVIQYIQDFQTMLHFFQGIVPHISYPYDTNDATYAKNLVKPVAKDGGAQLNIIVQGEKNSVNLNIDPSIATNIIEGANRYTKNLQLPETEFKRDQLLYFRMTEDTHEESKYTKGIIQAINDEPVPTYSQFPEIMEEILAAPYNKIYQVDVIVSYVNEKAVNYNIQKIKQTFDRTNR